jgi:hypothetical protein
MNAVMYVMTVHRISDINNFITNTVPQNTYMSAVYLCIKHVSHMQLHIVNNIVT